MADLPAARLSDYCAAKAAVSQLHECLRWELRNATGGSGGGGGQLGVQLLDVLQQLGFRGLGGDVGHWINSPWG